MSETKRFQVVDSRTGTVMGSYSSRKMASRKADKLDLEYGAIRYAVRENQSFDLVEDVVKPILGVE